jgi:hypothetical protein
VESELTSSTPQSLSQCYIFAGSIVPILNKILKASGIHIKSDFEAKPYRVVRVDTSKAPADVDIIVRDDTQPGGDDELEICRPVEPTPIKVDSLVGGEEDVGKGVARKMIDNVGASVFRGLIVKV